MKERRYVLNFNPRSHEGSDDDWGEDDEDDWISIHAPTKGATRTEHNIQRDSFDFNPRSHEGSD